MVQADGPVANNKHDREDGNNKHGNYTDNIQFYFYHTLPKKNDML